MQISASVAPGSPDPDAPWLQHNTFRDCNVWKFHEEATVFAKELQVAKWECAEAGLAVLPLQSTLQGDMPDNGPKLVMRRCMRELTLEAFKQLKNPRITKVAIIGNPGIGKSRNLDYFLRLLMGGSSPGGRGKAGVPQNKVIIFLQHKEEMVWAFVPPGQDKRDGMANNCYQAYMIPAGHFTAAGCAALANPDNFCLIDPGRAGEKEPTAVRANTILACSPDRRHYKEWSKSNYIALYASAWTLLELMAARQHMPQENNTSLCEKTLSDRFCNFGGIPRVVFGDNQQVVKFQNVRGQQLRSLKNIEDVLSGLPLDHVQDSENIPTHLFQYNSKPPFTSSELSVAILSVGARDQIFKEHYDLVMRRVCDLRGDIGSWLKFEDFVGWLLVKGACSLGHGPLELRCERLDDHEWIPETAFILDDEGKSLQACDAVVEVLQIWQTWKEENQSGVLRTPPGFPGIDFLLSPTRGVNASVGMKHSEPPPTFYTKYLAKLKINPADFKLFYFVPAKLFAGFNVPKSHRTRHSRVLVYKVMVPMSTSSLTAISTVHRKPATHRRPAAHVA